MPSITELYARFRDSAGVSTDTRNLRPGSVFVALRGETFDGNRFALEALRNGCARAIVSDPKVAMKDSRCLLVDDTLLALQQLATLHRRTMALPVVQITGTNGKTTTKELTSAVLATRMKVLATQGNLNNHIGLPLTLLSIRPEHQVAVVETGANHPGEIATLARIAEPDFGLITNIGVAHIEGFGSVEGVRRTKGELFDYLRSKPGGRAFVHRGDSIIENMASGIAAETYGEVGSGATVEGEAFAGNTTLSLRWRRTDGEWQTAHTRLVGAYNLPNALAAVCVGRGFGIADEEIAQALESYVPSNARSELRTTANNTLVVDAYNANPTSMNAALLSFAQMPHNHKMVILGEMRELGSKSAEAHRDLVRRLIAHGYTDLWLVGAAFMVATTELVDAGIPVNGVRCFPNVEAVEEELRALPISGRLILIKGSNATHLFRLPELL